MTETSLPVHRRVRTFAGISQVVPKLGVYLKVNINVKFHWVTDCHALFQFHDISVSCFDLAKGLSHFLVFYHYLFP